MTRWLTVGAILLALLLIAGAVYLGLGGAQGQGGSSPAELELPSTVQVTRGEVQQTVIAPGVLVETRTMVLSARIAGELVELHVRPGDSVHAGDLLARLQVDDLRRQIVEADSELRSSQLSLAAAEQARRHQIAQAKLDLTAAQEDVARARSEHRDAVAQAERTLATGREQRAVLQARSAEYTAQLVIAEIERTQAEDEQGRAQIAYKEALDRPWESQQVRDAQARELQRAERNLAVAQARHDQAQAAYTAHQHELNLQDLAIAEQEAKLARLQARTDPLVQIQVQQMQQQVDWLEQGPDPLLVDRVDRARRDLKRLQARLADAEITAPMDGVVLEVDAQTGAFVAPGSQLITMTDPHAVEAQTTVIEEDLPLVETGQPAELYFDAQPEATVKGRVVRVVPRRVLGEDRPLYPVYLAPVEELPEGLFSGMTVDASIIIDRRADVLRLPRAVAQTRADGTAQLRVWTGSQVETRIARVGLRGDVYVEILEGLREGEEVLAE